MFNAKERGVTKEGRLDSQRSGFPLPAFAKLRYGGRRKVAGMTEKRTWIPIFMGMTERRRGMTMDVPFLRTGYIKTGRPWHMIY